MANKKNQFLIIVFARYYNLFIEYLLLMVTALLMPASERGFFVMYISVIGFFSLVASLAYEQYGAAQKHKYAEKFDERNFFSIIVFFTLFVSAIASLFSIVWLSSSLLIGFLVGLNVAAINLGKQSIVNFQLSGYISKYFQMFILYKSIYFIAVAYATIQSSSIEVILAALLLPSVLFLLLIKCFDSERYISNVSLVKFSENFAHVRYLYFTAVITSLYSFVDLYIIYSNLNSALLSEYNLAIQLNMAIAVIGQAYNIHIFSDKNKQNIYTIIASMKKINLYIIGLSLLVISIVHTDFFLLLLDDIFGNKYAHLPELIRSTIWILPASLVSMFYAPIWISSGRYIALLVLSISGLLLFTLCALLLIHLGLQGIIYAQYLLAVFGLLANVGIYLRTKKLLGS